MTNKNHCSWSSRITGLSVGDCAAEAERFSLRRADADLMQDAVKRMRNYAGGAIRDAKQLNPGAEYIVESGDIRTRSYDIIICVTVTRTA
jgi:hypothetical protein